MAKVSKKPEKGVSGLSAITRSNWTFSVKWKNPKDATKSSNKARWEDILVRVTMDKNTATNDVADQKRKDKVYSKKKKKGYKKSKSKADKEKGKFYKKKTVKYGTKLNTSSVTSVRSSTQETFKVGKSATSFKLKDEGNFARKLFYGGAVKDGKTRGGIIPTWKYNSKVEALIIEVQPWNSKVGKKKWNTSTPTQASRFLFHAPEQTENPSISCAGRTSNHKLTCTFNFKNDQSTSHEVQYLTYNVHMNVGLLDSNGTKVVAHTPSAYNDTYEYVSRGNGEKNYKTVIDPNTVLRSSDVQTTRNTMSVLDMVPDEYIYAYASGMVYGVMGSKSINYDTDTKKVGESTAYLLAYPYSTEISSVNISDPDIYRVNFFTKEIRSGGKRSTGSYVLQMLRNYRPDGSDDWDDNEWIDSVKGASDTEWNDLSTVGNNEFAISVNKQNAKPQRFSRTYFRIKSTNEDFTPMYSEPVVCPDYVKVPSARDEKVKFLEALSTDDGKSIKITYGWHVTKAEGTNLDSSDGTELSWSTDEYAWRSNQKPDVLEMPDKDFIDKSLSDLSWAVETFTGTVAPTLSNAPASEWTTDELKEKHLGNIYCLDATSELERKYYKFSKTGNEYLWQLTNYEVLSSVSRPLWAGDILQGKKALRFDLTGSDEEANLVDKIGVVYIRGLSEGTPYYLKLRRYLAEGRDDISYADEYAVYTGDTLNPGESPVSLAPYTKPENLQLHALEEIAEGTNFSVSWTFESSGEQTRWGLYYGKSGVEPPELPSEEVTSLENSSGSWTKTIPAYSKDASNYFYSYEYSNDGSSYNWSEPYLDLAMEEVQSKSSTEPIEVKCLWFSKATDILPDRPTEVVISSSTEANGWTTAIPSYSNSNSHYFYCYEYEDPVNGILWTAPVEDTALPVILSQLLSSASSPSRIWFAKAGIDPITVLDESKNATSLTIPNPLTKQKLEVDEPPSIYEGTDQKGYATVAYEDVDDLLIDGYLYLVVKVWTSGEPSTSNVIKIHFSPKPNLRISNLAPTLTTQPVRVEMISDSSNLDVKFALSAVDASIWRPDGIYKQLKDEVIYSGKTSAVDWTELETPIPIYTERLTDTGDPELVATMKYRGTFEFPSNLTLLDLGRYKVSATGIDRDTGLSTEYSDLGEEPHPAEANFDVDWARKASPPSKWSYITKASGMLGVNIHVKASPDNDPSDVCDIYRVTPDGAYLVKSGQAFNSVITDRYAPFSSTAFTRYRLCTRTPDGDIEYVDVGYRLKSSSLRFDWGLPEDNPPSDVPTFVELPYNISLDDSYEKNFESRLHMDGLYQGYWNRGAKRKVSLSTDIIRVGDRVQKEALKALGRYPGPVYVRTPDGSAYAANVTLDTYPNDYDKLTISVKLTAEEIALPEQYMIVPTQGSGQGVESDAVTNVPETTSG